MNATTDMPPSFLPSEFADILYYMTPLSRIIIPQDKYEFVKAKFRRVRDADGEGQPLFVYGHFLVPHKPYVFASDGSRLPEWETVNRESKKNYIGQLQAANRMILETIDAILKKSGKDPIIVLTADEGPYLKQVDQCCRVSNEFSIEPASYLPSVCRRNTTLRKSPRPSVPSTSFDSYSIATLAPNWAAARSNVLLGKRRAEGQPAEDNRRFIDVTKAVQE